MSFYDDASLIMYPSGYKEAKLYSLKPTSGNGDLDFTRATDATRVNSDGLVEDVPVNKLAQSSDFDNSYWLKSHGTITANTTTAPNGTTTADTFTRASSTARLYRDNIPLTIGQYTQSIYAKANASSLITLNFLKFGGTEGASCTFDLSNGTAGAITLYGGASGFTAVAENAGDGWYRCSLGGTISIADTYRHESTITTGSIYAWGAQLNKGATAATYFPTTERLNVPRIDYTGGGCGKLLLEPQSTNLLRQSENLANYVWLKQRAGAASLPSVTNNFAISPDGTLNASRVIFDLNGGTTSGSFSQLYNAFSGSSGNYTTSVYMKSNDINTYTVTIISVDAVAHFVSVTPQWQRFEFPASLVSANMRIRTRGSEGSSDVTDISIWGAQVEAQRYATSYIPTLTSSETRGSESCSTNGLSSVIGQTEGTIFVEFEIPDNFTAFSERSRFSLSDGSTNNWIFVGIENGNDSRVYYTVGGVAQIDYNPMDNLFTAGSSYKIAFAYKNGDSAYYVNGVQKQTWTSALSNPTSALDTYNIGGQNATSSSPQNMSNNVKQTMIFETRLTDTELATLTTI